MKTVICHDRFGKNFDVPADKLIFRPSVYGILIEKNKILLSKQWDGYDLPGGGVEKFETVQQALTREFIEETGLEVEVGNPVYAQTSFFAPYAPTLGEQLKDQFWNCPGIYFLVKMIGGQLSIDNLEEVEKKFVKLPEWVDLGKIHKIKFTNTAFKIEILEAAIKLIE